MPHRFTTLYAEVDYGSEFPMKKLLTFIISALLLAVITLATLFGLLNTSYATPIAQWINQLIGDERLSFKHVEYDYPLHLRFTQPTIQLNHTSLTFRHLDLWFNPSIYDHDQWQIESALFDGVTIDNTLPHFSEPSTFHIHQLAIHNLSLDTDEVSATALNVQIKDPHWYRDEQWLPYGTIQLSAESLQWQGETMTQLLVDADHQLTDSRINGFSFHWRNGLISGQAERYPQGWSLVNVTMNHLSLTQDVLAQLRYKWSDTPQTKMIQHINSLDILNSNLQIGAVTLNNADVSIENMDVTSLWQNQGSISLHADNAQWKHLQWVNPDVTVSLTPGKITINDFLADIWQGRLQLSGALTPDSLHLSNLSLNGVRWYGEQDEDFPTLSFTDLHWPTIAIDQLDISNTQIIQLKHRPFWQLTGLNVSGTNLTLRHNNQWGLWQGQLSVSANSASIGKLHTSQAIIEMTSDAHTWSLTRAFLPLKYGYLKAQGSWPIDSNDAPWSLHVQSDGLPLEPLTQWVSLPISLSGFAEANLSLNGMAGSPTIMKHTLSGHAQGSVYRGVMTMQQDNTTTIQPFAINGIDVTADRGRISLPETTIQGTTLNATLFGDLDLVDLKTGKLEIRETAHGKTTVYDLLHPKDTTPEEKTTTPQSP